MSDIQYQWVSTFERFEFGFTLISWHDAYRRIICRHYPVLWDRIVFLVDGSCEGESESYALAVRATLVAMLVKHYKVLCPEGLGSHKAIFETYMSLLDDLVEEGGYRLARFVMDYLSIDVARMLDRQQAMADLTLVNTAFPTIKRERRRLVKRRLGPGPRVRRVRYHPLKGVRSDARWMKSNWLNVKLGGGYHATRLVRLRVSARGVGVGVRLTCDPCLVFNEVKLQGGYNAKAEAREVRDQIQRDKAKQRAKAEYKSLPKAFREKMIKAQRDKRFEHVELQGGKVLGGLALAAGAAIFSKISKLLRKASDAIDDTSRVVTNMAQTITDFVKPIKDFVKRKLKGSLWMIPIAMVLYYALHHGAGVTSAAAKGIAIAVPIIFGGRVTKYIGEFFRYSRDEVKLQSGVGSAAKLLATLFTFSIFRGKVTASRVSEFVKRISLLERAASGWETFFQWSVDAVETMVNYFRTRMGKKEIVFSYKASKPVDDWAKKVDALYLKLNTCSGEFDNSDIDLIVSLLADGHSVKEFFRGSKKICDQIDLYLSKLYNLLVPYTGALNARQNCRMEPECAIFTGLPGIGKTVMTLYVCTAVMLESGLMSVDSSPDKIKSQIWQKGNGKYWNSYSGNHCMIMDDIWQWKGDPSDAENQFMTLIRAISSWSFPLEFADVASKGKNFFFSKFVLGTCNVDSIDAMARNFIYEPEAVARRIHHPYKISVKPEYQNAKGELDYVKFAAECDKCSKEHVGLKAYPWYVWDARRHDFLTGRTSDECVAFEDVVTKIAQNLKTKLAVYKNSEESLNRYVKGFGPDIVKLHSGAQAFSEILDDAMSDDEGATTDLGVIERELEGATVNSVVEETVGSNGVSLAQLIREHTMTRIREVDNWTKELSPVAKFLLKCTALAVFTSIAIQTCKFVWGGLSALFSWASGSNGSPMTASQSNAPATKPVKNMQAANLHSGDPNILRNAYNNTYKMVVKAQTDIVLGQVMFIVDTLAVQPEHFTSENVARMIKNGDATHNTKIQFVHCVQNQHTFEISIGDYLNFQRITDVEADVEFIKFENVRAHRNIASAFLTEKQYKNISGLSASYAICRDRMCPARGNVWELHNMIVEKINCGKDFSFPGRFLKRYVRSSAPTVPGDCGGPLAILNNSSYGGRAIIGQHVAGNVDRQLSYSSVITSEMVLKAIKQLSIVQDNFEKDLESRGVSLHSGEILPFSTAGSFLPIGTIDKTLILCPKTSYYRTELYGAFGEYKQSPAPLCPVYRDGILIYPMDNAVKPYSSPVYHYDTNFIKHVAHVAFKPLTHHTRFASARIFDFDEAVCGIPELKFRAIPRQTAAGFPYCFSVKSGKTEFFGEEDLYDLTLPKALELRQRVEFIVQQAKQGVRTAVVFNDFLKDELRSEKKVEQVATRLISSAPLDYVIAWRMYFGDFSSRFMMNNTHIGMAPGICAYTDWCVLANYLTSKGSSVFAGDFKAFDSSEQPGVMMVILDYINGWYDDGEENALIRRVLWLDLVHSRHLGGPGNDQRYIYQWNKSLPSGHPFTTIVNSMYSLLLLACCYVKLTGDWRDFWTHVYAVTYGDDNVINVSESVKGKFNQRTVAKVMWDEYKMTYTSDDKESDLIETTTLDRVSFLKRRFYFDDGHWNCPLDLESFLYCVYYCKNKRLEAKIRIDELENTLEELSLHSDALWDQHAPGVYNKLAELKVPNAMFERRAYLNLVRSRADNWY